MKRKSLQVIAALAEGVGMESDSKGDERKTLMML